jgi:alpha-galactosidase
MKSHLAVALGLWLAAFTTVSAETVWLDSLDLRSATQGWGEPHRNKSVEGKPLSIGGQTFERGFGTHAESTLHIAVHGDAKLFSASVGVDDDVNHNPASSVEFVVIGDGKELWKSGVLHAGDAAKECAVDLSGVKALTLKVSDAGDGTDYDHADWVNAKLETAVVATFVTSGDDLPAAAAAYILTPPAPPTPRINGAGVFGARPGSPFMFTIAATGERPMKFSAKNLPRGLKLDPATGLITGTLKKKGEFAVTLRAKNSLGMVERKLRIVCGDQIALTPPMGWNSWNCFAHAVSEERVKRAADAMISSGLINHGWTYINVDDFWQNHRDSKDTTLRGPIRDANGLIVPNQRFPDMKGLADYIHARGLRAGLYSSPGPWTCGGCAGSFDHEWQDAATYAKWGFDYLKYDWCSYKPEMEKSRGNSTNYPLAAASWGGFMPSSTGQSDLIKPYELMHRALAAQPRDIVYSLCQYGMGDVWKWGGSIGGNCWRTTGDITDTWRSMSNIGFKQGKCAPFSKPGNWNDPDMLIIGQVGWGNLHPTRLTPDEQYTHISLWCLLSSPLLIGCDMEKFDDFTLNLLSNDEVLAVDQDALGKGAMCVLTNDTVHVYAKDLEDGGRAAGFFNLGAQPVTMDFNQLSAIGLSGTQHVRDLWRQKNLADVNTAGGVLPLTIPAHGVLLYKFTAAKQAMSKP